MNDNYIHNSIDVMYIVESIPGPPEDSPAYEKLVNDFNSQITDCCNCKRYCEFPLCYCLQKSGGANYTHGKLNNFENDCNSVYPHFECNNLCKCSYSCGNRVVQSGPVNGLYVMSCIDEKGLGLFTENIIPKGTFICEYAGELITKSQALLRHSQNSTTGSMNYIFCLQEHCNIGVIQTFVDPSKFGNIGRYINHSCEPNCVIIPVRVNIPIPKLAIFSCCDIPPNTEICFNYGSHGNKNVENINKKKCVCKCQNCLGWLPFDMY